MREGFAFSKFVKNLEETAQSSRKLRESDDNHALKNVWRD